MSRRSKPLKIAPLIPLLGVLGLFGIERFHGTRLLPPFVATWVLVMTALFLYVLKNVLEARRRRARSGLGGRN